VQNTDFAKDAVLIDELNQEADFLFAIVKLHRQVIIWSYDRAIYSM